MKHDPTKLPMTNEEIRREYLEAKDRKAQIRILADENLCSVYMIKKILEEEGVYKIKRCYARGEENDLGGETITTDPPIIATEEPIYDVKEPQTRVDEIIEEAVTLDAEKAAQLERAGETLQRFMEKRHIVTFTEDEYYTVNAIAVHMLDLNAKKIDRLEADLKRINEHLSEQRAVGNILRGIIEKVGGVPKNYTRLFKEGE